MSALARSSWIPPDTPGWLYTVCFRNPDGSKGYVRHAGHYSGWTPRTPEARLADHVAGRGAVLTSLAVARGLELRLVWTAPGSQRDEKTLKRRGSAVKWCPDCRP